MRKNFHYGKYNYKYTLIREDRKSLALTVTPDSEIVVKGSRNITQNKIDDFLKRKWVWLEKQLAYFETVKQSSQKKDFVSGESFYYLGRQYQLIVKRGASTGVKLKHGKLELITNQGVQNSKANKTILNNWFKGRAQKVFQERLEEVYKRFGYTEKLPTVQIKKMAKRWGSFLGKERIVLHPHLIRSSKDCIDYVISHELCHFRYKNHNAAFYRLLADKCPTWTSVKEKLEKKYL